MNMYKKLAVAGLALASIGMDASAQDTEFRLANNTGFTVRSVFIWPSGETYQGTDRLGKRMIPSGKTQVFEPLDGECEYNVRVTLLDQDAEHQWDDVNLCSLSQLTLNYNYLQQYLWSSEP